MGKSKPFRLGGSKNCLVIGTWKRNVVHHTLFPKKRKTKKFPARKKSRKSRKKPSRGKGQESPE